MLAPLPTLEWIGGPDGLLRLLDQTLLPGIEEMRDCRTPAEVWEAIRKLRVRGAPAIGVTAGYGVVLGAQPGPERDGNWKRRVAETCTYLATSRPTAVNLFWALERMQRVAETLPADVDPGERLLAEARAIEQEDREMCAAIGRFGAELLPRDSGVLTHCNAGGLATAGDGTALAVLFEAHRAGRGIRVFADETRPLLQGARLTAWELMRRGVPVTLLCDSMAGHVFQQRRIQAVVVGADRIAANGDTANKIGTYTVAVLAKAHGVPFYVAAPSSTFDFALPDGSGIPIEQRAAEEVTEGFGRRTAPMGVDVYNPAFDVTPAALITSIITERGIISPVETATIARLLTQ